MYHRLVTRKLIIIGMSANSDDETSQALLDVGGDGFIAKPFNVATIKSMLIKYIL